MRSGQTQRAPLWPLALLVILSTSVVFQSASRAQEIPPHPSGFTVLEQTLPAGELPPIALRFQFDPDARHHDRIVTIAKDALLLLGEWLGRYPAPSLTLVDTGWSRDERVPRGGNTVVISSRWLSPGRDVGLERRVIAALTRAYFAAPTHDSASATFPDAMVRYMAARAINQLLQGRDVQTYRFFGTFVPYPIRSASLSRARRDPRPAFRAYEELGDAPENVRREAEVLHTLERFIGWPAMQAALKEFAAADNRATASSADFMAVVTRQRGVPVDWWPSDGFHAAAMDWTVANLSTAPSADTRSFETHVQVRPSSVGGSAVTPPVDLVTRFEDGHEIRERLDAPAAAGLHYVSDTPAVAAIVDPDAIFVMDDNRLNNTRSLEQPVSAVGWRFTLNWMAWLQHLTLTYLALV